MHELPHETRAASPVAPGAVGPIAPAPITPSERVEVVDVLRGFALFGILSVNMAYFAGTFYADMLDTPRWPALHDRIAGWLIGFLAEAKFYSLFSLLFGFGMSVQLLRAQARGDRFAPLYARRLLVLLAIGLLHGVLIWPGDILVTYAVLGLVLLLFRRRKPVTLLVWAAILMTLPILLVTTYVGLLELARLDPDSAAELARQTAIEAKEAIRRHEQSIAAYRDGAFAQIVRQHLIDLGTMYIFVLFILTPSVLAMFLLGLCAGRSGVLQNAVQHRAFFRRVAIWGAAFGVPANAIYAVAMSLESQTSPTWLSVAAMTAIVPGAPAMTFFYAASIVLLWQREQWRRRLRPLAAVGRMALTNYLLQSLICTTIFNSYGLRLFDRVGTAAGLGLAIVIYAAQIPLSNWWLSRFEFGPMEWLWRCLTYMKRQPMRRTPETIYPR